MSTVRWRDVRGGDTVRDASGFEWGVGEDPRRDGKHVAVRLVADDRTPVWGTFRAKDPVFLVERANQSLDEAQAVVEEVLPGSAPAADYTDEEEEQATAATEEQPLVLPVLDQPLELRSHLWLLHSVSPAQQPDALEMASLHQRLHDPELLPGAVPHTHEEEK